MDIQDFYKKLDELLELDSGTIKGNELLFDNLLMDSLSIPKRIETPMVFLV